MKPVQLTKQQRSAVEMIRSHSVATLTGGPGTGKTTTCKEILNWARDSACLISCCAPSGKAAKRFVEATDFPASTIHKLLEARVINGHFVFARDEEYPLVSNLIVVDEASMVSTDLMADLLRAIRPGCKLLIVGDQDQLPSVGPGAVLRDILESKTIPHVELTEIHRNAGDIVRACHAIKHGISYEPSPRLDLEKGWNLRHIEKKSPSAVLDCVVDLVTERLPQRKYNPMWDIQVISPVNTKGRLSCDSINKRLQEKLNPNARWDELGQLHTGDKVIQTKNMRVAEVCILNDMEFKDEGYVVNGDLGLVERVDECLHVQFLYPTRNTQISIKENHLKLAYCITCHKMQGSESPVVIVPVHSSFNYLPFFNRSWIYTALSRAQEICITVGEFKAIETAIARKAVEHRQTRLKQQLNEAFSNHTGHKRTAAL